MAGAVSATAGSGAAPMTVILLGLLYICNSAGLIAFNKYLLNKEHFPYPVPLVICHAVVSSSLAGILFLIKPSLFPSLTDPEKKVDIDRNLMLKGVMPIAVCFAVQLALSNMALGLSTVAFTQMMKEANIVLVYALSLMMVLEVFQWQTFKIYMLIPFATALTIKGELHFNMTGFVVQAISQVFESVKIVMQAALLTNAGKKLDVFTYLLIVMPICALSLATSLCLLVPSHPNLFPPLDVLKSWSGVLALNSLVAFSLNAVISFFMKNSSAVAFILAGIVKDAAIVLAGTVILAEDIATIQAIGFAVQLACVGLCAMTKTWPAEFEDGIVPGLMFVFGFAAKTSETKEIASEAVEKGYGTADSKEPIEGKA